MADINIQSDNLPDVEVNMQLLLRETNKGLEYHILDKNGDYVHEKLNFMDALKVQRLLINFVSDFTDTIMTNQPTIEPLHKK